MNTSTAKTRAERREQLTSKPQQALLDAIAREHLSMVTLQTRNSDELDFHDLAVWNIKAALEAAYEAGKRA